eukprot:4581242-Amphidinium_carterae.1
MVHAESLKKHSLLHSHRDASCGLTMKTNSSNTHIAIALLNTLSNTCEPLIRNSAQLQEYSMSQVSV